MNTLQVAVLSVLTLALFGQMVSCWDQKERDYILNIHREMRKRPGACDMKNMEYDMQLESAARGWAERCVFKHEMKPGRGENLAWNTNKYAETKLIDGATDSWYDEIKMYSYGQRSCSRSCHYTQIVWANTNKVGCWSHRCPNLSGAAANAWYLVCFYTPMGNWNGEKPYKTSGCEGSANGGSECKDSNTKCSGWASRGECDKNPAYMKKKCQKSCNSC